MNRRIKSAAISAVMIIFSITLASIADAGIGMGDCGEVEGDCYSQFYIGVTGGEAEWDLITGATISVVDEYPIFYGTLAGYRLNRFFAFEVVGNYFGEPDYEDAGVDLDTRICNTGLGLNFYLPLGRVIDDANFDFISAFARGGMHYWDFESENSVTSVTVYDDDGFDFFYSYGVSVDLQRHFAVRGEYTTYEIGDDETIDTTAITFIFKF